MTLMVLLLILSTLETKLASSNCCSLEKVKEFTNSDPREFTLSSKVEESSVREIYLDNSKHFL